MKQNVFEQHTTASTSQLLTNKFLERKRTALAYYDAVITNYIHIQLNSVKNGKPVFFPK